MVGNTRETVDAAWGSVSKIAHRSGKLLFSHNPSMAEFPAIWEKKMAGVRLLWDDVSYYMHVCIQPI